MARIQLEHVTKVYPISTFRITRTEREPQGAAPDDTGSRRGDHSIIALDDISLTIEHGETMSIIGPSGCGKSTLLRAIAGLEPMTSGRVLYDRQDMLEVSPGNRGIGIVFQSYALYPHMSSKNNLAFFFRMHKRELEINERVRTTAQIMGMDFDLLLDRMPGTLSAGQKQRVALGRCIARDPKLILLDEPLSNLDAKLRSQTRGELKRLLHHFDVTSVYVTHDQIEAIALADRLAVMRWGKVEQVGSYLDVYQRPVNAFVGSFVGTPPMNFLDARILPDEIELDGVAQRLPRPRDRYLPGLAVRIGVRPEDIVLENDDPHALRVPVEMVEYLPSDRCYFVYTQIGPTRITARLQSAAPIRVGDVLPVRFAMENVSYFDRKTGDRVA